MKLEATSEDTRVYEICILIPFPLSQKEEKEAVAGIEAILKEAEAKELFKDEWGRRGLAYNIGGYTEGKYIIYYCEMKPENIKEMDQALSIANGVLRHLIVKPPKDYEAVSLAGNYEDWQKEKQAREDEKAKEKEERMKKKMLQRQKVNAKRGTTKKDDAEPAPAAPKDDVKIDAEIDKLIADDELEL